MRVITALAAPVLLALVLTSPMFPAPRAAIDSTASQPGPRATDSIGVSAQAPARASSRSLPGAPAAGERSSIGAPLLVDEGESSIQAGVATYCAENPPYCIGWSDPDAFLGAMPGFTYGDAPFTATVCRSDGSPCVDVTVVSFCACGDRPGGPTVIDLSPAAFRAINGGSLAAGVIDVTVEIGGLALPPTDTE